MARKINSSDPELTLEEYATLYIKKKAEQDKLEKELKSINSRMKELMQLKDQTEAHCELGVVKYVVQHRSSFDEEKALSILKSTGNTICIKTKEYIDMEILEKEMYNERISGDAMKELKGCNKVKEVVTLTISGK